MASIDPLELLEAARAYREAERAMVAVMPAYNLQLKGAARAARAKTLNRNLESARERLDALLNKAAS